MGSSKQKGSLIFEERMKLLRFEREMALEREAIKVRSEECKRRARMEEKGFELELERERQKDKMFVNKRKVVELVEVREMRENKVIDDYFRIFEMTAKSSIIPTGRMVG